VYENLGQYKQALDYYKQALVINREINDKRKEGDTLSNIGVVYDNLGQYQQALENYQQALEIQHKIDDQFGKGAVLTNIGVVYRNLGQYQQALKYYQQALEIQHKIDDKRGKSSTLVNIGIVYKFYFKNQKAFEYYYKALEIQREIGDKRGEGETLSNIGGVYNNLGQYEQVLKYLKQALEIRRKIGDKRGEAFNLGNIGAMYGKIGQYQQALIYLKQGLSIWREIDHKRGEAIDLGNIGAIYGISGQYQQALEYFKQALSIQREIGNKHGEASELGNIGVVYGYFGQYQQALEHLKQALVINQKFDNKHGKAFQFSNIGAVYKTLGDYQKSKEAFQNSANILEKISSNDLWVAQRGLAVTAVILNQFEDAIKHYEQAINNLEKLRTGLKEKEHKLSFMPSNVYVYEEFITLLQTLHQQQPTKNYDRKALTIFERKQGRVFLEEMGKSGAWRFGGVPEETSRKDREFEQKIATARKNRTEALQKGFDAEPHRKRLEELLVKQQPFEKMLAEDYPKYHALKYPKPVSLAILQNELLQPGEMMLVYNVMKESTALWVIGKHQFQMLTLDISEEELQAKVNAFRQSPNCLTEAIDELPKGEIPYIAAENLPILRQASYDLYQLLMPEKVKTLLKDTRTLYIVPTGSLYGLPFGALDTHNPADKPHYLIQDYPIAYLSSASLLKTIRIPKHQEDDRYPFLAFADPKYPEKCPLKPDNVTKVIQAARTEAYLKLAGGEKEQCFTKEDELKETGEQAEAICHLLKEPENNNSLQLGNKASRSNVFDFHNKERLNKYKYVLFAAHAVLPNEISHINQSAIVLSNPDTEGYLTMADVFGLQMNADLVFLSACNTGGGKEIKGEGIRGLTRAFMYAGTPAVSVSLWKVASSSAKKLSIGLFEYLQAGKPLAQALRQSKLDLMANEDMEIYQHPFFWAPFVVFGDGS
jgi:CHAT domain-containing protein/Tfp pilus assembly protein PilF